MSGIHLTVSHQLAAHAMETFRVLLFPDQTMQILHGEDTWAIEDLLERHALWAENLEDPASQPDFDVWLQRDFECRGLSIIEERGHPRFVFRMRSYTFAVVQGSFTTGFLVRPTASVFMRAQPGSLWALGLLVP